jgi:hypothetical protein
MAVESMQPSDVSSSNEENVNRFQLKRSVFSAFGNDFSG